MTLTEKLYYEVGKALHAVQIVEYNITSAHILLARTEPSFNKKSKEENWSKKTLGKFLYPLIKSGILPEDAKFFIETVLGARNHLAHSFFVSLTEVHTQEGIKKLLREVEAMNSVFSQANLFFEKVLSELASPLDIDLNTIKSEARIAVLKFDCGEEG